MEKPKFGSESNFKPFDTSKGITGDNLYNPYGYSIDRDNFFETDPYSSIVRQSYYKPNEFMEEVEVSVDAWLDELGKRGELTEERLKDLNKFYFEVQDKGDFWLGEPQNRGTNVILSKISRILAKIRNKQE